MVWVSTIRICLKMYQKEATVVISLCHVWIGSEYCVLSFLNCKCGRLLLFRYMECVAALKAFEVEKQECFGELSEFLRMDGDVDHGYAEMAGVMAM